jgi:hypothetical protein
MCYQCVPCETIGNPLIPSKQAMSTHSVMSYVELHGFVMEFDWFYLSITNINKIKHHFCLVFKRQLRKKFIFLFQEVVGSELVWNT